MNRVIAIALLVAAALPLASAAEPETPGGRPHRVHALVHATVVPRPGERIEDATVVIRDGVFPPLHSTDTQLQWDTLHVDIFEQPEHRRDLLDATGRQTVPCLRIEDPSGNAQWMHESADIVTFLEQQAG